MRNLLGGKGANLAEMTNIGLPVPPGFTISTEACDYFSKHNGEYPEGMREEVLLNLKQLETTMGAKLGDSKNPLLVSVRFSVLFICFVLSSFRALCPLTGDLFYTILAYIIHYWRRNSNVFFIRKHVIFENSEDY